MIIKESQYKNTDIEPLVKKVRNLKNPPKDYQRVCLAIVDKIHNEITRDNDLGNDNLYLASRNRLIESINNNPSSMIGSLDVIHMSNYNSLPDILNPTITHCGFSFLPMPKSIIKRLFFDSYRLYKQVNNDCLLLARFSITVNSFEKTIVMQFEAVGTDDSTLKSLNLLQESTIFDNIDFI